LTRGPPGKEEETWSKLRAKERPKPLERGAKRKEMDKRGIYLVRGTGMVEITYSEDGKG